jgi:hypothetical protein
MSLLVLACLAYILVHEDLDKKYYEHHQPSAAEAKQRHPEDHRQDVQLPPPPRPLLHPSCQQQKRNLDHPNQPQGLQMGHIYEGSKHILGFYALRNVSAGHEWNQFIFQNGNRLLHHLSLQS